MMGKPPLVAEAKNGGFSVLYRGISLYSRIDPRRAPERIASETPAQPETLYIVPSPALGYGLETLLGRIPASSAVLALETDGQLAALSADRLPSGVRNDPRFLFLTDSRLVERAMYSLGRFRRCVEVPFSFGRTLYPEIYEQARKAVETEIGRYWRNRMTMIHMGRLWMRNLVRNLGRLPGTDIRSWSRWKDPVVVCGAGPSLDSACEWMATERRRIRILACDTAVGPLLLRGLVPDAVACLEGQAHNLKDFLPARGREIPLFADLTSHPSTFRAIRGPKALTMTRFEELSFLDRLEALSLPALRLPPLGSVGVLAVRIARSLTDGPVFLTGLDFSFRPGATHAKGSPALWTETFRQTRLYRSRSQWNAAYAQEEADRETGERSGSVLRSYAGLLTDEVSRDPRVFDIRASGLPLGLARTSFAAASRILDAHPVKSVQESDSSILGEPVRREALVLQVAEFLTGERSRLERLLAGLRSASLDLKSLVLECDWIYSWFPDEPRVPGLPPDVRNRLLAEGLDWIRRIDAALSSLGEP